MVTPTATDNKRVGYHVRRTEEVNEVQCCNFYYLRSMLPKDDRASKRIIAATTTVGSCIKVVEWITFFKTKQFGNVGFFVGFVPMSAASVLLFDSSSMMTASPWVSEAVKNWKDYVSFWTGFFKRIEMEEVTDDCQLNCVG